MATGRIGTTPALGFRWSESPAGGTTSLSGLDDNSVGLSYTPGNERVYRNGVLLSRGSDYTATDGTTITLEDATITGDIIEVFSQDLAQLTDAISKSSLTAKGTLLSASAASTLAVLGVGANDTVLTADSAETTGLKWATPAGGGKVLQVVQATYTTSTSNSTITFADTGLSATITPSAATSKVLIMVYHPIRKTDGNAANAVKIKLQRTTTDIHQSADNLQTSTAAEASGSHQLAYVDSPATTSARTYKTVFSNAVNAATAIVQVDNRRAVMILMEIGA